MAIHHGGGDELISKKGTESEELILIDGEKD
jgi:hypothetical protein